MARINLKKKNYTREFAKIEENVLIIFKNPKKTTDSNGNTVYEVSLHNGKSVLIGFKITEQIMSNIEPNLFYILVFQEKKKGKSVRYWMPELYETGLDELTSKDIEEIKDNFPDFIIIE